MLDNVLLWLTVGFVIVAALSAAGFLVARWLFVRTAERVAQSLEQRMGGAGAHALTRLGGVRQGDRASISTRQIGDSGFTSTASPG